MGGAYELSERFKGQGMVHSEGAFYLWKLWEEWKIRKKGTFECGFLRYKDGMSVEAIAERFSSLKDSLQLF